MGRALFLTALLSLGCTGALHSDSRAPDGSNSGPPDGGAAVRPDASADARVPVLDGTVGSDAAVGTDAGPPPPTFEHVRELRGAWVASVYNLTWPSRTGLSESASRAEIVAILERMRELRMNAVFVQVRAESDAFYRSTIEPWSRFLTGTQGNDPGWDPLTVWIEEGHARGIEVHAWINPYRGMTSSSVTRAANHITHTLSQHAVAWGSNLIVMDPGASAVRAHVVAVVRDLVSRYDVDGIHFDDYFYPYPGDGPSSFPDDATYAASGTSLSRADWRRENVNTLIREVHEAIADERDDVRFGISPFGIYRPGMPPGISGLDAYATLYADAPLWIAEGWIDYLAPQLYWRSDQTAQAFGPLIEWWSDRPRDPARSMLSGMNLTKLLDGWPASEIRTQIDLTRGQRAKGARGYILYRADQLVDDAKGMRALFAELNAVPAATPPLATAAAAGIERPSVQVDGRTLTFSPPAGVRVRAYAIYDATSGSLVRLVHGTSTSLEPGSYGVTAIDRRSVESAGVLVELN